MVDRGVRIDKNRTGEGVKIRPLENIVENRKGKKVFTKKGKTTATLRPLTILNNSALHYIYPIIGTIHLRRRYFLGGRGQKFTKFADG